MTRHGQEKARWALPMLLMGLAAPSVVVGQMTPSADDEREIRRVVMEAYVQGMHGNGDRDVIRAGFHPDFVMKVLRDDGSVTSVTIQEWMSRLPAEGTPVERPVEAEIPRVLLTGNTAVAEIHVAREGQQIFTDYISLYRFPEGWRMVAKVFYNHPTS